MSSYVIGSTGFEVGNDGYIAENPKKEIKNPHGTVISLILRFICREVRLISVNILNEKLSTDGRVLIYAMERVLELEPDIIHLSLGTTRWKYRFPIGRIVKNARRKGIIIVASAHNEGLVSYPAYLKGVIGVKADAFDSCFEYYYKDNFFYAPFSAAGIPGIEETESGSMCGTSIAGAYISGHIANAMNMCNSKDIKTITNLLAINSFNNRQKVSVKNH